MLLKLNNGTKATVLEIIQGGYNVEVVDKRGNSKGKKTISDKDIVSIIYQSKIKK